MRSKTKQILSFLVVSGIVAAMSTTVFAQTADDISRLREQIERNAELLEQAKELVSETSSVKARSSLETAMKLHMESVRLFEGGPGSGRLQLAAQFALKAREAILQTIALAKKEAKLEENAIKAIERARNRLEQAKHLMDETGNRDLTAARKLIDEARTQLERAQDNMREHLYEIALRLAVSSEQLSSRAIAILKRDLNDPQIVEREILRTDRALERLRDEIHGDTRPAVQKMYEEAAALQQRAKDEYQRGNLRRAMEMTQNARRVAMRAVRLLGSETNRESVEQAIRLTNALLIQAREIASDRESPQLIKQIEHAEELQRRAENQLRESRYERALRLTLRARDILKNAIDIDKKMPDEKEVRGALSQTDDQLARLREDIAEAGNETAAEVFARAESQQEKAWDEFSRNRLRAALAHTRMARNLVRHARRLLDDTNI
ncbi:MAG: hypothetical protein JSW58_00750 [Candidatus Latescibacterota bacterium]|nr:MAG: hypothetical protein JSW58_00750 [Candidatus Latescibacterota bacterium]